MVRRIETVDVEQDLGEVEGWAAGLKEAFLYCREMGHTWRPHTAKSQPDGGFERTLRCGRCKTKRKQSLDRYGMVVSSGYIHPEGYLHEGMGRITGEGRGLLRLESLRRFVAKSTEAEDDEVSSARKKRSA